jgi:hypothetical protein
MHNIVVVGPVNGLYHLAYDVPGTNRYLSINPFVSKELADITAWRMNFNRQRGIV